MAFGDLVVTLGLNAAPFASGLAAANNRLNSFSSGVTRSLGAIRGALGVLAPIGAGIGAALGFGAMVNGARDAAAQQNKLQAVLKATGGAAGLTAGEISTMADSLASMTNFEDDATIGAAGVLASFKAIKGDTFKSTMALAQDLSAVMGTDLQSSVTVLGKALSDPTNKLAALTRVGVQFTDQQKNQIKAMQGAGDLAGAQSVVLGALQSSFGGAAQAMADPFIILQNNVGNAAEAMGAVLLPTINLFAQGVSSLLKPVTENAEAFSDLGYSIRESFADGFTAVGGLLNWLTGGFADATNFVGGTIMQVSFTIRQAAALSQLAFLDLFATAIDNVPGVANAFGLLSGTVAGGFAGMLAVGQGFLANLSNGFHKFRAEILSIFDGISAAFAAIWNGEDPLKAFTDRMASTFITETLAKGQINDGLGKIGVSTDPVDLGKAFNESFMQSFALNAASGKGAIDSLSATRSDLIKNLMESEISHQIGLSWTAVKAPRLGDPNLSGGVAKSVKVEALQAGSKEAYSAIQSFLQGGREDTAKAQLMETQKQTDAIERNADATEDMLGLMRDNQNGFGSGGDMLA